MSELISGKEALIELSKDNVVQYYDDNLNEWVEMDMKLHHSRKFRLKPQTITINGSELSIPPVIETQGELELILKFNKISDRNVFLNTLQNRHF